MFRIVRTMASNYIVNVPKLRGRENYSEWCFAAENFLVLEGMKHCVIPVADKKVEEADDEKTKAKLIMTIDPTLYVHIKTVKSSKELWEKLRQLFDDSGFSRRISLLRNLISIRLENCSSMTSYVTQIIDTSQKLSGTGFEINDQWTGSLLLAGLPDRFAPMIMAIEHSGISITADSIKTKLLDMSSPEQEESEVNGAFATRSIKFNRKKNTSLSMAKNSGNVGSIDSVKSNKMVKCYSCKQTGHYRNQCPLNENSSSNSKKNNKVQSNAFSAVFLSGNFNKHEWYIDSGASVHLTANESYIMNAKYDQLKEIIVANNEKVSVLCSGNARITTKTDECEYDIMVEDIFCVPSLTTNLLSVSQLINKGNKVSFSTNGCKVYNRENVLVATASLVNGVYKVNLSSQVNLVASAVSAVTWHRRMGHVNKDYLKHMNNAVHGMSIGNKIENISKSSCITCCEGKQSRLPFQSAGQRSNGLLEIVHTDICGPMEHTSIGGSRYFLLFIDDHSRMTFVYFLRNKNEALKYFKQFKAEVENQTKNKVKILRSDNGLEYCNKEFDMFLNKSGILHQKTNPYTPEQNGLSERFNRTIVEKARCMLFDANLGKQFWAEATSTAVYLQNRTVAASLGYKTPYEIWNGTKPDISHVRIFGSSVMVHIAKEKRKKWDKKSEKCILIGYPENIKGYRLFNPETKKVLTSRDVIIIEPESKSECQIQIQGKSFDSVADGSQSLDPIHVEESGQETSAETSGQDNTEFLDTTLEGSDESYLPSDYEDAECKLENVDMHHTPRPTRERKKPERFGFSNLCMNEETYDDAAGLSLSEALQGPEKEQWKEAMREELQCFKDNDAWELCEAPTDSRAVQCKWVLRKKYDSEYKVRFRARLVAKGFSQIEGVDYTDTFSPVVRHTTLRLLFALSVQLGLNIRHLDVTTAFLNGTLEETIFMRIPVGFSDPTHSGQVLKLKKAIYGLKQSSRMWYKKVDECLLKIGYFKSKYEPCMYLKRVNKNIVIVTLYVDDFFIFSNDLKETQSLKDILANNFKIKDLGELKKCLGVNVNIDKCKKSISLNQKDYIEKILHKFHMSNCKTVLTPMESKLQPSGDSYVGNFPYQQIIGCLMYLAVLTRPDIAFAVGFLSQFNNSYTKEHCAYVKRILKYLKKTKDFGLVYSHDGNSLLEGYVDSDWGGNIIDRRSYTGYCFTLSGCIISWECKKQQTVALSSSEAEYMAMTEACKEAIYLKNLQFEITKKLYSIDLYNDNQSAQKLAFNPVFHKRTKHIDIRYHFCRDCVSKGIVNLKYMSTAEMPADLLTKALCSIKHHKFLDKLGIQVV